MCEACASIIACMSKTPSEFAAVKAAREQLGTDAFALVLQQAGLSRGAQSFAVWTFSAGTVPHGCVLRALAALHMVTD